MKFISTMALCVLATTTAFGQSQAFFSEWKGFSAPEIMSSGFTHKMSALPLEGSIESGTKAWSGHFWASREAGINIRWNSPKRETFKYNSPSKAAVASMSLDQLATLSPTEKYDLYMGRYNYPLRSEAQGSTSKTAPDWAGICHGWAPASLYHNEPTPKTMTNPDGIKIPFGSSDIKALLSYFYAFYLDNDVNQVGLRCHFGSWLGGARACNEDLNAGAFHIIISNRLGLESTGLLMDRDRYRQVWNQPVVSYKSRIIDANLRASRRAADNAVREMRISTELFYVDESNPTWHTVHGTKDQKIAKLDLEYRIELNANGEIVGGEWESEDRPDFLWEKPKATGFDGLLSDLGTLLND